MERLGHNHEKNQETMRERVRRFGEKVLDKYVESMTHGNYYVSANPHSAYIVPISPELPTSEEERYERMYNPDRDEAIEDYDD